MAEDQDPLIDVRLFKSYGKQHTTGTREGDSDGRVQPWSAVDAPETLRPNHDWGSEGVRRESPDEPLMEVACDGACMLRTRATSPEITGETF